jgi:2-amino-4-hydroxy-6-hydroxymethyldihydropteridine diphosphokinase
MGDRAALCSRAVDALKNHPAIVNMSVSPVYETEPVGVTNQPPFLNLAAVFETGLTPETLLKLLKKIEKDLGRKERFRWGPREVDLDILLYDSLVLETPSLVIPHPEMHTRSFVLVPACDIYPNWVHPVLHQPLRKLLDRLTKDGIQSCRGNLSCA